MGLKSVGLEHSSPNMAQAGAEKRCGGRFRPASGVAALKPAARDIRIIGRPLSDLAMALSFLLALISIAIALSVLMALAWVVQQRTGNSGWVDTIWTFAVGGVGAISALWP